MASIIEVFRLRVEISPNSLSLTKVKKQTIKITNFLLEIEYKMEMIIRGT
jgi:hypothetical protein